MNKIILYECRKHTTRVVFAFIGGYSRSPLDLCMFSTNTMNQYTEKKKKQNILDEKLGIGLLGHFD